VREESRIRRDGRNRGRAESRKGEVAKGEGMSGGEECRDERLEENPAKMFMIVIEERPPAEHRRQLPPFSFFRLQKVIRRKLKSLVSCPFGGTAGNILR